MTLNRNIEPATKEIEQIAIDYPKAKLLETGHEVYFDTYPTNLATIKFVWFDGYNTKPKLVSSALSDLMFTATNSLNAHEINKMMKTHGCTYRFNVNETYSELVLRCLASNYKNVLPDFLNLFLDAEVREIELETYKQGNISAHKSKLNTPGYWCAQNLKTLEFDENHIYGRKINIEDYENLEIAAVSEQLKNYSLHNCVVFIGAADPSSIWKETVPHLEKFKQTVAPSNPTFDYFTKSIKTGETIEHKVLNTNQISLKASFMSSALRQEDFNKAQLINIVLGGFFGSRLMQEVREKRGLTYGISSSINQNFGLYVFRISSQLNAKNKIEAINAIKEIVETLQKNGISKEEFARAKRYYLGQLYATLDNPGNITEKIIYARSMNLKENAFETKCTNVLDTSLEELNLLVKRLVDIEKLNWSLAGDV